MVPILILVAVGVLYMVFGKIFTRTLKDLWTIARHGVPLALDRVHAYWILVGAIVLVILALIAPLIGILVVLNSADSETGQVWVAATFFASFVILALIFVASKLITWAAKTLFPVTSTENFDAGVRYVGLSILAWLMFIGGGFYLLGPTVPPKGLTIFLFGCTLYLTLTYLFGWELVILKRYAKWTAVFMIVWAIGSSVPSSGWRWITFGHFDLRPILNFGTAVGHRQSEEFTAVVRERRRQLCDREIAALTHEARRSSTDKEIADVQHRGEEKKRECYRKTL